MEQKEAGQKITAYKGFDKNFQCMGFQYEVGKEYKSGKKVEVCRSGFHACTNPLEVWDYYPVYNSRFAEVELGGVIDKEDCDSKICSSEIKIKKELTLSDYIGLCIAWMNNLTKIGGNSAQICSSGDYDDWSNYHFGAIIGSVEIVDCVQSHPSIWAEKGAWNWVLENPVMFPNPITGVKGKLSFWNYDCGGRTGAKAR